MSNLGTKVDECGFPNCETTPTNREVEGEEGIHLCDPHMGEYCSSDYSNVKEFLRDKYLSKLGIYDGPFGSHSKT